MGERIPDQPCNLKGGCDFRLRDVERVRMDGLEGRVNLGRSPRVLTCVHDARERVIVAPNPIDHGVLSFDSAFRNKIRSRTLVRED